MKIAIVGTHGIGKTTLAYQIAAEAKKKGRNALVINEIARRCPFPLNDKQVPEGAEWIISTQISHELSAKANKTEYIICDRSAYDPICYMKASKHDKSSYRSAKLYASEWLKTYDKVFLVVPDTKKLAPDGFRCTDINFQELVNDQFMQEFQIKNICPHEIIYTSEIFESDLSWIYKKVGLD